MKNVQFGHVTCKGDEMRYTNLRGHNAAEAMKFMRDNNIHCVAKLERERERCSKKDSERYQPRSKNIKT
ncbi:hypothetical protein GCM10025859_01250 [Alicyclobacillus fastidiosus]|nr:hypothetical protein GCM10025859_01250 [Alicyclobacillus fastidiosus]